MFFNTTHCRTIFTCYAKSYTIIGMFAFLPIKVQRGLHYKNYTKNKNDTLIKPEKSKLDVNNIERETK